MVRRAFYSFHYNPDNWRAAQVRNMGVIEGNSPASDNDWEAVKKGGDPAIKSWIDRQLIGKSCAVVLIGSQTAGRKWINYEIEAAWKEKKGLLGIYIHNLKNLDGKQSSKGVNPFTEFNISNQPPRSLASIVRAYDPPYLDSKQVYSYIFNNFSSWIEEAIAIRQKY